jgi:hypothetical protein
VQVRLLTRRHDGVQTRRLVLRQRPRLQTRRVMTRHATGDIGAEPTPAWISESTPDAATGAACALPVNISPPTTAAASIVTNFISRPLVNSLPSGKGKKTVNARWFL